MIVDFRNMPGLENLVDMQALEGLQNKMIPGVNIPGGTNLAGNLGGVFQNIVNMANASQQQQPVLGPDDFGFYQIPVSDPTYRSGFDYARSIAGGIPMEQVIAPGVSYSPEMPMGYTQAQLNTAVGTTPTPPAREPDDPRYFGTGIGGVNIPIERDKKSARLRDIFGGSKNILPPNFIQAPEGARPGILGNIDFSNLPERGFFSFDPENFKMLQNMGGAFDFDREAIDKMVQERIAERMPTIEQPDLSQFVRREDIPSLIPQVPTGREFSIEDIRRDLDLPDFSQFARQQDIPTIPTFEQPDLTGFARLEDIPQIPTREDFLSIAREGIDIPMPQQPDVSQFVTQEDINRAIAGIDIPTYQAPDLSGITTRLSDLEKGLLTLQEPTGGRFSVQQQRPIGLFA